MAAWSYVEVFETNPTTDTHTHRDTSASALLSVSKGRTFFQGLDNFAQVWEQAKQSTYEFWDIETIVINDD